MVLPSRFSTPYLITEWKRNKPSQHNTTHNVLAMLPSRSATLLLLSLCSLLLSLPRVLAQPPPPPHTRVVADGFNWAENVHFDAYGALYATDLYSGTLFRITSSGEGNYTKQVWIGNADVSRVLGMTMNTRNTDIMYLVAKVSSNSTALNEYRRTRTYPDSSTTFASTVPVILIFSPHTPNTYKVLSEMPTVGNGLDYSSYTNSLYVSAENDFLPNTGQVFKIDCDTGNVVEINMLPGGMKRSMDELLSLPAPSQVILERMYLRYVMLMKEESEIDIEKVSIDEMLQWYNEMKQSVPSSSFTTKLWGPDGLWIDPHTNTLLVGELMTGKIWGYSLHTAQSIGEIGALAAGELPTTLLDDFTLNHENTFVFGCNWNNGSVAYIPVTMPRNATETSTIPIPHSPMTTYADIVSGIQNPTSVRWGSGIGGFHSTSVFISEGTYSFPATSKCRILEVMNVAETP